MAAYEWRCRDCGQGWVEPGRGNYVLTAINHMRKAGHHPLGLVDTETGEVVIADSLDRNTAEKMGIIEKHARSRRATREVDEDPAPATDPADPAPPPRRAGSAPPITPGADASFTGGVRTVATKVDNLPAGQVAPPAAQVLSFDVQWPSWALAYFDLLRTEILDDAGEPYAWGSKPFVRFVLDVYRHGCRDMIRTVQERKLSGIDTARAAQAVAATIATIEGIDVPALLAIQAQRAQETDPEWAAALQQAALGG